jgi:hypothetical protein
MSCSTGASYGKAALAPPNGWFESCEASQMSVFEPRCRKEKVEGFAKARLRRLSVAGLVRRQGPVAEDTPNDASV